MTCFLFTVEYTSIIVLGKHVISVVNSCEVYIPYFCIYTCLTVNDNNVKSVIYKRSLTLLVYDKSTSIRALIMAKEIEFEMKRAGQIRLTTYRIYKGRWYIISIFYCFIHTQIKNPDKGTIYFL